MVVRRTLLVAMLALTVAGCTHPRVSARPRPLSPPANERRVGERQERRADPPPVSVQARRPPAERPEVSRVVGTASSLVGRRTIVVDGVDYGDGCAALVRAAFEHAGRPLPAAARDPASIYALASERGVLKPAAGAAAGDVVFLANQPGGSPAHIGIVERVDGEGKALVLHRVARGVMRLRVSLAQPGSATDAKGKRLNDLLVVGAVPVPAGKLVVAFAALL